MTLSRAWHWPAAIVLSIALAAPCIELANRQTTRQHRLRALHLSDRMSMAAPPVRLERVDQFIAPYRRVVLGGEYDHVHEILIRGRRHDGEAGFHVVTPLRVGDAGFLIVRGWIPPARADEAGLLKLREPGQQSLEGIPLPPEPAGETAARRERGATSADLAEASDGEWPLQLDVLDVPSLRAKFPYAIFRYVIQPLGGGDRAALPIRLPQPDFAHLDLSQQRIATALYLAAGCLAALPFVVVWRLRKRA